MSISFWLFWIFAVDLVLLIVALFVIPWLPSFKWFRKWKRGHWEFGYGPQGDGPFYVHWSSKEACLRCKDGVRTWPAWFGGGCEDWS